MSKQALPVGPYTRRILRWHDAATPEQAAAGSSWYGDARTFATALAEDSPHSIEQVAYVIAALSPQCTWDANKAATTAIMARHADGHRDLPGYAGYTENARKGFRILDGDLGALKGPKVTAFALAILGDLSYVVVDVWMLRAARSNADNLLFAYTDGEMPGAKERRAVEEAVRRAAAARGIEPSVMQARAWEAVRSSGRWVRPQHMDTTARNRFWARQARARIAAGLSIPYDWNSAAPAKVAAYA